MLNDRVAMNSARLARAFGDALLHGVGIAESEGVESVDRPAGQHRDHLVEVAGEAEVAGLDLLHDERALAHQGRSHQRERQDDDDHDDASVTSALTFGRRPSRGISQR